MVRSCIVYLIRHGEAIHNIEERVAMERAKAEAIAEEGWDDADPRLASRMEQARQRVLEDATFFDAPLSEAGHDQAQAACKTLQEWTTSTIADEEHAAPCLPPPQEIFVSPLRRTLQTAKTIFPNHPSIRVREELRERLTGRPADNRVSSEDLVKMESFQHFSFRHLRINSFVNVKALLAFNDAYNDEEDEKNDNEASSSSSSSPLSSQDKKLPNRWEGRLPAVGSSLNAHHPMEDENKLVERTKKFLSQLAASQQQSIAVITHKGFLRALERGTLGVQSPTEFGNCEMRVYELLFGEDRKLIQAKRVK